MSVKLVSYTQPPPGDNQTSLLDLVAFCARVSNPENQNNTKTSEKLVRYLIKNEHWSPLEMVSVCLEIETTRDIARQILRHRSFSFQEFSQRYAVIHEEPIKFREVRLQDHKNRQNSIETADAELQDSWKSPPAVGPRGFTGRVFLGAHERGRQGGCQVRAARGPHDDPSVHERDAQVLGPLRESSGLERDPEGARGNREGLRPSHRPDFSYQQYYIWL
jgi:hypothetical protein